MKSGVVKFLFSSNTEILPAHTSGVRYQDFNFDMLSIRYWGKYRNFDTIFDNFQLCGGIIAWAADIYKCA